ncbi:hypothetical protein Ancab_011320 [Ancistrocladus abbreviatus]
MQMGSANQERGCHFCRWLKAGCEKLRCAVMEFRHTAKKLAKDDPRRIVHSMKVGLAITLVSLFYYFEPLYEGFGVSAMWAVLTVVVVFEYSVGATLGKGVNRVVATTLAGLLGVGAHRIATLSGEKGEPIVLGLFVFLLAAIFTYLRFFPKLKARYDYGLMIFILTFSLVSVSGYREDEVIDTANKRMSTILMGTSAAAIICFLICPVWAGRDLHDLTAVNLEKLGNFLEEFGVEYFKTSGDGMSDEKKAFMEEFKTVINSKNSEDTLVNFANWEPRHGRFRYRHPWSQYQKIGNLARHCASTIEALHGYLHAEIQATEVVKSRFEAICMKMSTESGKALKELSSAINTMTQPPSSTKSHLEASKSAARDLNSTPGANFCQDNEFSEVIPVATVASLLVDVLQCTEKIAESVQELASLARFKSAVDAEMATNGKPNLARQGDLIRRCLSKGAEHVVMIEGLSSPSLPKYKDPPSLSTVQQSGE